MNKNRGQSYLGIGSFIGDEELDAWPLDVATCDTGGRSVTSYAGGATTTSLWRIIHCVSSQQGHETHGASFCCCHHCPPDVLATEGAGACAFIMGGEVYILLISRS